MRTFSDRNIGAIENMLNHLQTLPEQQIIERYGDLRLGYRASRTAGNCESGTKDFITRMREAYRRKHGVMPTRDTLTVREIYDLMTYIYVPNSIKAVWILYAIAGTVIKQQEKERGVS